MVASFIREHGIFPSESKASQSHSPLGENLRKAKNNLRKGKGNDEISEEDIKAIEELEKQFIEKMVQKDLSELLEKVCEFREVHLRLPMLRTHSSPREKSRKIKKSIGVLMFLRPLGRQGEAQGQSKIVKKSIGIPMF